MSDFPSLLAPIRLGPLNLSNRAIISGHTMRMGDGRPGVSPRLRRYLTERARGGAALVTLESSPVHPTSRNPSNPIELWRDDVIPSLSETASAVQDAGSKLSIILWHGGHNVPHRGSGQAAVAPSVIPSITAWDTPRALRTDEIPGIVHAYGAAAKRCMDAGLDAVEIQTSTDYLLGSFLSPTLNKRTDQYGGSRENRSRIVREVLEEVRRVVDGRIAVGLRTSAAHHIPTDPNDYAADESIEIMAGIAKAGLLDWISVMTGSHWSMDMAIPLMEAPRAMLENEAQAFKAATGIPVMFAGRIRSPEEAEKLIAAGKTDMVAMTRTWIAEPEWIKKIEAGESDRIRPCMTCNQGCIGFVLRGMPGSCVINPSAGREDELPKPEATPNRKKIAVIGGGPAGLEFARVAALRGHTVTLYEKSDTLGGAMLLASRGPSRSELSLPLMWWQNELDRLNVEVRLNSQVTSPIDDADETVWAIGASADQTGVLRQRPHLSSGIPGTESAVLGRDVMAGLSTPGGRVLVIDEEGGWPALSVAEYLTEQRAVDHVTLVTSSASPGAPEAGFTYEQRSAARRMSDAGIAVRTATLVDRIENGAAITTGGESIGPFESIVLVTGSAARPTPERAITIGDCTAPRGMWAAIHDAAKLARAI